MQNDNSFDQKSSIIVLEVFLMLNFKKIRGSKYENVNKLNTGIMINLRNFLDWNYGILKNAEPDPITLGFL